MHLFENWIDLDFIANALPIASAVSDTTPPSIVSFDFEPKVVDMSKSDQNVKFTMQLKDDLSGVYNLQGWFKVPLGTQNKTVHFS